MSVRLSVRNRYLPLRLSLLCLVYNLLAVIIKRSRASKLGMCQSDTDGLMSQDHIDPGTNHWIEYWNKIIFPSPSKTWSYYVNALRKFEQHAIKQDGSRVDQCAYKTAVWNCFKLQEDKCKTYEWSLHNTSVSRGGSSAENFNRLALTLHVVTLLFVVFVFRIKKINKNKNISSLRIYWVSQLLSYRCTITHADVIIVQRKLRIAYGLVSWISTVCPVYYENITLVLDMTCLDRLGPVSSCQLFHL